MVTGLVERGRFRRSTDLALYVPRSVLNSALDDGLIVRNPAARIDATGRPAKIKHALDGPGAGKAARPPAQR
jgi:hypothetical protein